MNARTFFSHGYILGAIAIIVVGGGAYAYYKHTAPSYGATITVEPSDFTQTVEVEGTVQAAQNVDLGFDQSGTVAHVYAQVGDTVEDGAKLAELVNGDQQAGVAQAQAAVQAAQAQLASLQSGTRPETIAITQTQIQNDQAAISQAQKAVVNALRSAYTVSDDAIHNKADQLFTNPLGQNPTLSFTTTNSQLQSTLISERLAVEPVLDTWQAGIASVLTTTADFSKAESQAQNDLAQVSQFLSDANATLNTGVASQTANQTTLDGYISVVGTVRTNVNAAQTTLTSAVSALQSAQAALSEDQKNLALQQAGSTQNDIAAQQAIVAQAQAALQASQATLARSIITAPFAGTVAQVNAKVGQVVSPNAQQVSMISNGVFQIVAYVPEVEIAGVQVGDEATTTLDAYGPNTYFNAKVIAVDPAETVVNGVSTYKTTLQFNTADPRIKSGMTANLVIETQNVPDALSVPLGAVFQSNGQSTVQVVRGNVTIGIPVTIGNGSSLGNVLVTSGLQPGDVVSLSPNTTQ